MITAKQHPFYWGVASSAFQTEGAHDAHGKGPSIWDSFTNRRGVIANGHHAQHACNFYNRYKEDIQLMASMNIPNFRFSVSWPRVLPEGIGYKNESGLDFYKRLIDTCLENNITPWITLYHWDLPQKLEEKGGWTNRNILHWFEEYIQIIVSTFKDRVKHWMVLNEPMVYNGAGYFLGVHAPGRIGIDPFLKAMHHTLICQAQGIRQIKAMDSEAHVGTTFSCSLITAESDDPKDGEAAVRADALLNRLYIEPLLGYGYPFHDLPFLQTVEQFFKPGDETAMVAVPDFIGMQNYTREVVKYDWLVPFMKARIIPPDKRQVNFNAMNWEVLPESVYHMLKKYAAYKEVKEIIITESGSAYHDQVVDGVVHDHNRQHYLSECIALVDKALKEGVPVKGYFVWSFTDNFEWSEGYRPRFGLVYVDYHNQQRIVKSSGKWYASFLKDLLNREQAFNLREKIHE